MTYTQEELKGMNVVGDARNVLPAGVDPDMFDTADKVGCCRAALQLQRTRAERA